MSASDPALAEDVDLDLESRRYVLDMHSRLERLDHYEVLGVPRGADKKTVKRAYFRLAGLLHPDRYFSKKLGSFKSKMEMLFARTTMAFEVLSDRDQRAQYDARLGPPTTAATSARPAAPVDPRVAAKRKAALEDLEKRFAENAAKAKRHAELAERARAAGDLEGALDLYETALTYAPRNAALEAAKKALGGTAATQMGSAYERQALLEERFGHWTEAARSWEQVVQARPDDASAKERLANARARAKA